MWRRWSRHNLRAGDDAARRQVDGILARFPGPVTLYVSRPWRLFGLALNLAVTAIFASIWIAKLGPQYRAYDWIMLSVAILFFGTLAIRAVILLLFPGAATLTLDAEGFEIGRIFDRIRMPWRGVSEFRVETPYWDGRIGGSLTQIRYEPLDADAGGRGSTKRARVLGEFYGQPRLRRDELARLMNEWRRRALAQPASSKRHVPLLRPAP